MKLFTSKVLYETYPDYPEGKLSQIRSILEPIIVIETLDITSQIIDLDKFFVFIEKVTKMFPPAPTNTTTTITYNYLCYRNYYSFQHTSTQHMCKHLQ